MAIELILTDENYHKAEIVGLGITDKDNSYYVSKEHVTDILEQIKNKNKLY